MQLLSHTPKIHTPWNKGKLTGQKPTFKLREIWAIRVRLQLNVNLHPKLTHLAGLGSLIPSNRNYRQQMSIYEGNTCRAGLSKMHGLRHAYAQNRYKELTGWKAPAAGGPVTKDLTSEQREIDREVRLQISRDLGHYREAVVSAYLGK
jgi:hypothetical protein